MDKTPDRAALRPRLCHELRTARTNADYTVRQACAQLGWSESKLARIESGEVGLSPTDLTALLDLYGVHRPEIRQRLAEMARQGRRRPWHAFADVLGPQDRAYLTCEGAATRLRHLEVSLVPELLRTAPYARAVAHAFAVPGTPARRTQRLVEAHQARRAILERDDPPRFCFVIDELALRRWAAPDDPAVMHGQLRRLHELADHPSMTIRILPLRHGVHRGLTGSFTALTVQDDLHAVFLVDGRGRAVRAASRQVTSYQRTFDDLAALATPADAVHAVLDSVMADRASRWPPMRRDTGNDPCSDDVVCPADSHPARPATRKPAFG